MKIHCLGTAGYHPSESRQTSCYFIPEVGVVLDAGTGFFRLPKLIETDWLDIFLSHAHLDHVAGLTFLLDVLFQRPVAKVRVWGRQEKLHAVRQHLFSEHIFPVQLNVEWCEIVPGRAIEVAGGGRVTSFPLVHPGGSIGFRFDWPGDHTLAYVTDTTGEVDADYVSIIAGSKLLLHECNFRDDGEAWAIKTGHTWTSRAAEVAAEAEIDRLLLVHINPVEADDDPVGIKDARKIFAKTETARDGLVVEF